MPQITRNALLLSALALAVTVTGCARDPEKRTLSELAVSGSKSMVRTDSDMQKVLNALTAPAIFKVVVA